MKNRFRNIFSIFIFLFFLLGQYVNASEKKIELIKTDWSFKGIFGKFDRGELRRGYQVYTEVCSGCHSISQLSYRNLSEKGGPEFSVEIAKNIASNFEVIEMLTPGKLDADIVRNKVLKGEISLDNNSFLKTILLDKWQESGESFQEFLSDNMMSGHMWAVAKKIS